MLKNTLCCSLFHKLIIIGQKLFDGTVPSNKKLYDGTVPSNKKLYDGTVPSNKRFIVKPLFDGTLKMAKFKI